MSRSVVNIINVVPENPNQFCGGRFDVIYFLGYPLITYKPNYKSYCCNQCSCEYAKDFNVPVEVVTKTSNVYDVAGRIRLLQDIQDSFNFGESQQKQITQD